MTFHRVKEKRPLGTFPLSILELVQLYVATSALAGALVGESGDTNLEAHNLPNGGKKSLALNKAKVARAG